VSEATGEDPDNSPEGEEASGTRAHEDSSGGAADAGERAEPLEDGGPEDAAQDEPDDSGLSAQSTAVSEGEEAPQVTGPDRQEDEGNPEAGGPDEDHDEVGDEVVPAEGHEDVSGRDPAGEGASEAVGEAAPEAEAEGIPEADAGDIPEAEAEGIPEAGADLAEPGSQGSPSDPEEVPESPEGRSEAVTGAVADLEAVGTDEAASDATGSEPDDTAASESSDATASGPDLSEAEVRAHDAAVPAPDTGPEEESAPDPAPDPEGEPTPDPEGEPVAGTLSEQAAETEPDQSPEPAAVLEVASEPEPQAEREAEPEREPETETEPEAEAEDEAASAAGSETDEEDTALHESDAVPVPAPGLETSEEAAAEGSSESEVTPEAATEAATETASESGPEPDLEPAPDPESDPDLEPESELASEPEPAPESEPEPAPEAESEAGREPAAASSSEGSPAPETAPEPEDESEPERVVADADTASADAESAGADVESAGAEAGAAGADAESAAAAPAAAASSDEGDREGAPVLTAPAGSRRKRLRWGAAVLAAVLAGYAALDAYDYVPGVLTTEPQLEVQSLPHPQPSASEVSVASPLAESAPIPQRLDERLAAAFEDAEITGRYSYDVRDMLTGEVLADRDADTAHTPASVTKVLTGAAALGSIGANAHFTTRAVLSPSGDAGSAAGTAAGGEEAPVGIHLVGGGDVLLGTGESDSDAVMGHAGLATLAQETAASLAERGITAVTVAADLSRYSGDGWHDGWERADVGSGFITPIAPLMQESAFESPDQRYSPRQEDAPAVALATFAEALRVAGQDAGLTVETAEPSAAPDGAEELGSVDSAPVSAVVDFMLGHSDNVVAEVLGREVAVALGREATAESAPQAVIEALGAQGIPTGSISLADTSGLDYANRISAHDLTAIIEEAATSDGDLSLLVPAMPVGGWSGTLAERFRDDSSRAGAGVVVAKTGTLSTVSSLAGTVLTADGRLLVFSLMADEMDQGTAGAARQSFDTALASVAGCGCP
jgi:D-alanyl-D-alanine carboxypeptidase/D-alanyl-D-alanine-endopeptidase (penicillin-binding protein 4)